MARPSRAPPTSTDAHEAAAAVRLAVEQFGRLDVLYNNTGIYTAWERRTGETEESDWDQLLAVDLKTHFLTAKFAVRAMARQRSGVIINVAAARGQRGSAATSATRRRRAPSSA